MTIDADPSIDARRLLAELDVPHGEGRRQQIVDAFADGLNPLLQLLAQAGGPSKGGGEMAFAVNHLLARSISDLLAGVHLGAHIYLQQAYSVMRPVFESIDLINLFAEKPELAERWVNAEEPGKEFSPRQVRGLLGRKEPEEVYGHFSEVGPHPRFAGAQLTGGMLLSGERGEEEKTALLRIGPYFPDHPRSLHIYLWAYQSLALISFTARHLELVSQSVNRADWLNSHLQTIKAISEGCKTLRAEFLELGSDGGTEFLETIYDDLMEHVEDG